MRQPDINDWVVVTDDHPKRKVYSGQLGTVCDVRFDPVAMYSVEFVPEGGKRPVRIDLRLEQIRLASQSPFDLPGADGRGLYI